MVTCTTCGNISQLAHNGGDGSGAGAYLLLHGREQSLQSKQSRGAACACVLGL